MLKEKLIELVRKKLEKIPEINIAHEETISLHITMAFNEIMYATFRKNKSDLDLYSYPYTVTVTDNQATLPVSCYQLPQNAQIRSITPTEDNSTMIVPVSQGNDVLYRNLDVGKVDTTRSFTLSGDTVTFDGLNTQTTSVKMWLVTSFEDVPYGTNVYVPSGKDIDFLSVVTQIATGQIPNLLNNG